jgi:hypothetical protein
MLGHVGMSDSMVIAHLALELESQVYLKQRLRRRADSRMPEHAVRAAEVLAEATLDARCAKDLLALAAALGVEGDLLA